MTARPAEGVRRTSTLQAALAAIAALFEVRPAQRSFTAAERWMLLGLVVLGAVARFWGVGSFGLHGPDEATTALPALHILQDGWPRFPSGMLYTRAVAQSYLIAGAVELFGNNEWAIRLPSVLCGTALIALVTLMGRRFLSPVWNLAFAAVVALLPGLIADSQIARMYIFLSASLALYTHWVFRWEATGRVAYLVLAAVTMMVGIHFHQLAIFGSLVIFMPPLLRGDRRWLGRALLAFVAIMLYFVYIRWTPSEYPLPIADFDVAPPTMGRPPTALGLRFSPGISLALALAMAAAGFLTLWPGRRGRAGWTAPTGPTGTQRGAGVLKLVIAVLFAAAAVSMAALFYHLGVLLLLAALIVAARAGWLTWRVTLLVLATVAVAAGWQLHAIRAAGGESLRKSLGVMIGQPSIWQYAAIASFSYVAALLALTGFAGALHRLARREPLADLWLYFMLAVAIPAFVLGVTDWYFPARYTEFALLPLLLTAVGVAQRLLQGIAPRFRTFAAALAACAIVNPLAVARAVDAGRSFPDHRDAALYVKSQHPGPTDIIVAEDVLYAYYYLGHIDYLLLGRATAKSFVQRVNGQVVYQYTHTPLLGTAAELEALLRQPGRGTVYIIGSGEDSADNRRFVRGADIAALMESDRLPVAYVAPDGLTRVWRVPPGAP